MPAIKSALKASQDEIKERAENKKYNDRRKLKQIDRTPRVKAKKPEILLRSKKAFFRVSQADYAAIQLNASLYGTGNLSDWVRSRAMFPMLDVSIKMADDEKTGVLNHEIFQKPIDPFEPFSS